MPRLTRNDVTFYPKDHSSNQSVLQMICRGIRPDCTDDPTDQSLSCLSAYILTHIAYRPLKGTLSKYVDPDHTLSVLETTYTTYVKHTGNIL